MKDTQYSPIIVAASDKGLASPFEPASAYPHQYKFQFLEPLLLILQLQKPQSRLLNHYEVRLALIAQPLYMDNLLRILQTDLRLVL